jgi:hypothetical protein
VHHRVRRRKRRPPQPVGARAGCTWVVGYRGLHSLYAGGLTRTIFRTGRPSTSVTARHLDGPMPVRSRLEAPTRHACSPHNWCRNSSQAQGSHDCVGAFSANPVCVPSQRGRMCCLGAKPKESNARGTYGLPSPVQPRNHLATSSHTVHTQMAPHAGHTCSGFFLLNKPALALMPELARSLLRIAHVLPPDLVSGFRPPSYPRPRQPDHRNPPVPPCPRPCWSS